MLNYAVFYCEYFQTSLPPPWTQWTGASVLDDPRADPADLTSLVADGALSEYVFHLAAHVNRDRLPLRPRAVNAALAKANRWRTAQTHAAGCKVCRKLGRSVADESGAPRATSHTFSSGQAATTQPDTLHAMTVYPECAHSRSDRGDTGGGGGWGWGGGGGGGGGGDSSGGGGGGGGFGGSSGF